VNILLAESSSFWHHLADLGHNHLAILAVSKIRSDCHATMRTGKSTERLKLLTQMPCPQIYVYDLAGVEVFF